MPRKTNFVLTQQQEHDLIEYALSRVASLKETNQERWAADKKAWQTYENDVKCREGDKSAIFSRSNVHLPLTATVIEYFMARAEEATVDEPPYFDFSAVGPSDAERAKHFDRYYNWKLDTKGKTFATIQDAMLPFFVQRATILKAAFVDQKSEWMEQDKMVLHDKRTGQPVEVLNLGVIIQGEDAWEQFADPTSQVGPDGSPAMQQRLAADPTIVFDENIHEWRPVTLRRTETLYRGPKSIIVESDRFLCPDNATSIDEADVVGEIYDKPLDWFRSMWVERAWASWNQVEGQFRSGDASEKTDGEKKSKENLSFDTKNPKRKVVELWIRRDVLGWGVPQEFVIFIDEESRQAVYYEFQAKVCPDMKRPYTAIAIGKTKNRWCGPSLPEKIEQYQLEADKQFNSESYRNKIRANPFKGGDKSMLKDPNQDLDSDPEKYIELKQGGKMEELFQFAVIPDLDERTQFLVDYIFKMVQLWLGVSNIAQGDYSNLPDNNTKYGIEATLVESSKVSRRWIRRILRGLEEHVLKLAQVAMATVEENAVEVYEFTEGKTRLVGQMTAQEVRSVEVNVKLRMRKRTGADNIERARAALEVQKEYAATPPPMQPFVRPLLAEILEQLEYKDVDKLLPPVPGVVLEPVMPRPAEESGDRVVGAAAPAGGGEGGAL